MLAVAISVLFGFVAFAALTQVIRFVGKGLARGRAIMAELSDRECAPVTAKSAPRLGPPAWRPVLAAA
jgi:hypothetical protein